MILGGSRDLDGSLAALPKATTPPPASILEGDWWRDIGRNIAPAMSEMHATGLSTSRTAMFADAYEPIVDVLNEGRSPFDRLGNPYRLKQQGADISQIDNPDAAELRIWSELERARTADPGRFANLPKGKGDFENQVYESARATMDEAARVRSASAPGAAMIGGLIGGTVQSFEDPINVLALGLAGSGAQSVVRFALTEGAAGAAGATLAMPDVAAWRRELGRPMTAGEMVTDIAAAGVGSAAIAGTGRALGQFVISPAMKGALNALRSGDDVAPNVRTAAAIVEDEVQRAEDNPFGDDALGRELHRKALNVAARAADEGTPQLSPQLQDRVQRAAEPAVEASQRRDGFAVQAFTPDELETNATMMQYKRGADDAGMTERLKGVEQWNPAFAGQVLVYETRDGRRIVADGHQRLGLAKRLAAEGQDVTLYGVTLREADGVTPRDARMVAALKNIAEGSGDTLDAAAILREAPLSVMAQLPPRSNLVRGARSLANLSDDAWGMAWNGVASADDAALVGRLVNDKRLHAAILDYVTKAQPDTREEAELIVRQALAAGAEFKTQTDMFGAMLKADLVLPERVKILKNALTSLRKDRALFTTLTERETRIAAEGNVLAGDANARAKASAEQLFETIKALAERKGPISDALQTAAVESRKSRNRAAAIRSFVADVRGRVERGELRSDAAGRPVGDVDVETAGAATPEAARVNPADDSANLFADPVNKPDAFVKQRGDIARELGGEAMHAEPEPKTGAEKAPPPPEGEEAHQELMLFDAFKANERVPVPDSVRSEDGTLSVGELKTELTNEAKAVERLRRCATGETQ